MRRKVIILICLLILTGCDANTTNNMPGSEPEIIKDEKVENAFGVLDCENRVEKLVYRYSNNWQGMSNEVNEKMVGQFDEWSYKKIGNYNLSIVVGYKQKDNSSINSSKVDSIIDDLEKEHFSYSYIERVYIDDSIYGHIFDVSNGTYTAREMIINTNNGQYIISVFNNTDILCMEDLEFANYFFKNVSFSD